MKKCECCKKSIKDNRKYCVSCANYTLKLRIQISTFKHQLKEARKKMYGVSDGRQRLR